MQVESVRKINLLSQQPPLPVTPQKLILLKASILTSCVDYFHNSKTYADGSILLYYLKKTFTLVPHLKKMTILLAYTTPF